MVIQISCDETIDFLLVGGLVVRIRRSHRRGRGSIPRLGRSFVPMLTKGIKLLALIECCPNLERDCLVLPSTPLVLR